MVLRNIERADIERCARLYAEVFASPPWNEPWSTSAAFSRLNHFYESKGFAGVLAEKTDIVSFALGNTEPFHAGNIFYLREMCTASDCQSQGFGSRILSALEDELRLHNVERIYLTTEREIPAATFYLRNGLIQVESMGFYAKRII